MGVKSAVADKGLWLVIIIALQVCRSAAQGYKNFTVGDNLGWYDKLQNPKVDYQKWAADKKFSLGDSLLFNTDSNHSIVQTYNFTTYKLCGSAADAPDNDTIEWSSADPSSTMPHPVSVPVMLVKVGPTYFFSSDYDGEQCQNGQRLVINVTYGLGLPRNPDDAAGPVSPQSGDDTVPDTIVPSNFDHPKDISDDDDANVPSKSFPLLPRFGIVTHMVLPVGFLFFYF